MELEMIAASAFAGGTVALIEGVKYACKKWMERKDKNV